MKTKNFMKGLMVVMLAMLVITGCKKKEHEMETEEHQVDEATQKTTASDQSNVDQESNYSMDEVNKVLNNSPKTRTALPCNVDIDSSALYKGLIKLTYNGLSCDLLRKREGVISIQLPYDGKTVTPWSTKGAKIIVTYDHYKVTRVADNKTIMFNGATHVTNVNGGGLFTLMSGTTIIHRARGSLEITFDDGTKCSWGLAASRSYTLSSFSLLSTEETGDTTINGHPNTSFWGVTRSGQNFSVSVTTPVVTNLLGSLCIFRPWKGVRVIHGIYHEITITYGVDITGTPVVQNACPYGYKLNWVDGTNTPKQVVLPYW